MGAARGADTGLVREEGCRNVGMRQLGGRLVVRAVELAVISLKD